MKSSKPQSLTTDTRLSQSHFFNSSHLNKTNLTTSSQKQNNLINNTFQQFDSKEADFLKVKNAQLQQRVKRMSQQMKQLQENKIYLLRLNEKYIKVVNQYYRDLHKQKSTPNIQKADPKQKYHPNLPPQSSTNQLVPPQSAPQQILAQLQKDHRNLVKHCLVMQNQIKNYAMQMERFNLMKEELFRVNHTTPKELIAELEETVAQNRELKRENNRVSFELEKYKAECNRLKKAKETHAKHSTLNNAENQKLKAQINRVIQQSVDKSGQYQQNIYQLQLKVQKLEKQLRSEQQFVKKNVQKRAALQMQRVQSVHENSLLRANLSQVLDPKKHPLLSLERSFVHKKKPISLNKSLKQ